MGNGGDAACSILEGGEMWEGTFEPTGAGSKSDHFVFGESLGQSMGSPEYLRDPLCTGTWS